MAIFTKLEFETVARSKAGLKTFSQFVNESRSEYRSTARTSIFLSHSHFNKAIVEQSVAFFKNLGISIYVDWMDITMPESPNATTAMNIRRKIKENDKFILLATNEAVASKWCNWELGIGDVQKYDSGKIAILPLADNNRNWEGNEYLSIYPRIERSEGSGRYYIHLPGVTAPIDLETWLRK